VELHDAIDQYNGERQVTATDPAPAGANMTFNFRRGDSEILPVPISLRPGYRDGGRPGRWRVRLRGVGTLRQLAHCSARAWIN
jgi:hypothetical protein